MRSQTKDLVLPRAVSVQVTSYEFAPSLVTLHDPGSARAEAIRALRTHLMARHVQAGRRALALCEASAGAGCTFVATNVAVAMAQVGLKTLLIDANLREPQVDHVFRPSREMTGLRNYLMSSEASVSEFVTPEVLPNLSVLFAGGRAVDALELLSQDSFEHAVNECLRDYDITIVDTAPANGCADARRISEVVGYSLVVARRNVSVVADVKTLVTQLRSDGVNIVGTVFNDG